MCFLLIIYFFIFISPSVFINVFSYEIIMNFIQVFLMFIHSFIVINSSSFIKLILIFIDKIYCLFYVLIGLQNLFVLSFFFF
jgi:hypothetical protein